MKRRKKTLMKKVIKFRPELFWDVDPRTIDLKKNARYIIERVLDFGNDSELKWLWNYYPINIIREMVLNSRGLNKQTRSLWTLLTVKR